MSNKFNTDLVKANVFKETENTVIGKKQSSTPSTKPVQARTSTKRYSKMLENLQGETTYGVNCQIPLRYYRRMRDYKDLHKEESFQSIVLSAIIEWIEKNA